MTFSLSEISQSESVTDDIRNRENKFVKERNGRQRGSSVVPTYEIQIQIHQMLFSIIRNHERLIIYFLLQYREEKCRFLGKNSY